MNSYVKLLINRKKKREKEWVVTDKTTNMTNKTNNYSCKCFIYIISNQIAVLGHSASQTCLFGSSKQVLYTSASVTLYTSVGYHTSYLSISPQYRNVATQIIWKGDPYSTYQYRNVANQIKTSLGESHNKWWSLDSNLKLDYTELISASHARLCLNFFSPCGTAYYHKRVYRVHMKTHTLYIF